MACDVQHTITSLLVCVCVPPQYLNSLPEGEGHTEFPLLDLSVRPERNCALLFCNTTLDISA